MAMFSLFRPKHLSVGVEMADALFDTVKTRFESGQDFENGPKGNAEWKLFRGFSSLDEEIIKDEWLYFQIYIIDLATFVAFGNTPKRQSVLDPFIRHVTDWLRNRPAPPIEEARIWLFPDPANPLIFPPEDVEPAVKRLNRRLKTYAETAKAENELGNMSARVLSALCGVNDIASLVGINAYFTALKAETVKILKSIA